MKMNRIFVAIVAFLSIGIAPNLVASTAVPPPTNIDEYLNTSDLVVLGRIGPVVKAFTFYGYQENAEELERLDAESPINLGAQFVDYEIIVEEVVSAASSYRGGPLILRMMRSHSDLKKFEIAEDRGKFLLFLTLNPDGATYGLYSHGHKVNIDDERPMYYFDGELFDIMDGNTSSQELIFEVRGKSIQ